uniref:Uncharacterized protein n=1 Tax=Timema poppense TaxID=170557 RepID=A0A7R9DGX9_TIMPO|nr:unnamed protein product [Timema poppensis]
MFSECSFRVPTDEHSITWYITGLVRRFIRNVSYAIGVVMRKVEYYKKRTRICLKGDSGLSTANRSSDPDLPISGNPFIHSESITSAKKIKYDSFADIFPAAGRNGNKGDVYRIKVSSYACSNTDAETSKNESEYLKSPKKSAVNFPLKTYIGETTEHKRQRPGGQERHIGVPRKYSSVEHRETSQTCLPRAHTGRNERMEGTGRESTLEHPHASIDLRNRPGSPSLGAVRSTQQLSWPVSSGPGVARSASPLHTFCDTGVRTSLTPESVLSVSGKMGHMYGVLLRDGVALRSSVDCPYATFKGPIWTAQRNNADITPYHNIVTSVRPICCRSFGAASKKCCALMSHHMAVQHQSVSACSYSSLMASLVLTDNSQLTADGFGKTEQAEHPERAQTDDTSEYSEHSDRLLVLDLFPPISSTTGQLELSLKMDLIVAAASARRPTIHWCSVLLKNPTPRLVTHLTKFFMWSTKRVTGCEGLKGVGVGVGPASLYHPYQRVKEKEHRRAKGN